MLIVLKATGGLEVPLTSALASAVLPVVVVNPRQVRDFAKARSHLTKTDVLGAQTLAQFAEVMRPTPRPLPDAEARAVAAVLARRRQLVEMLTAEKNRFLTASLATPQESADSYRLARTGAGAYRNGLGHDPSSESSLARKRGAAAQRFRRRPRADLHLPRQSAGTRYLDPTVDRRASRRGPAQPG
jgi:hypothetical protein